MSNDEKTQPGPDESPSGAPGEWKPEQWQPEAARHPLEMSGPGSESAPAAGQPASPGDESGPAVPETPAKPTWVPPPPPPAWPQPDAWPQPNAWPQPPTQPGWPAQPQGWPQQQASGWPPQASSWPPQAPAWPPQPSPSWPPQPSPSWPPQPSQGWTPPASDSPTARRSTRLPQILVLVAACLISFSGGMVFDHLAFPSQPGSPQSSSGSGTAVQLQGSGVYDQALEIVRGNYVGRADVTDKQLLYGSIKGMVEALGDTNHSVFLTPEENKSFEDSLNSTLGGIGVLLDSVGDPIVLRVLPGSPAEKAGLKIGDQITLVDGVSTNGWDYEQMGAKLRGEPGTSVQITILHAGSTVPVDLTLVRASIALPLVTWGFVPGTHIADILLTQFADGAADKVIAAIKAAEKAGATSIILDLRGNPGGYADQARQVASEFLTSGNVYLTEDANGKRREIAVDTTTEHTSLPLIVLVDRGSASSSEIVAGAIQDAGRAKILGVSTIGTGTVLQKFVLSDGSAIFLGVEYWLTPSGQRIFGRGITPDIKVSMPAGVYPIDPVDFASMSVSQLNASGDAQLLAAVKELGR
jgi:carboxyl-terminal processing protease